MNAKKAKETFGFNLQNIRIGKGITQTDLQHGGVSYAVYTNIENGGNYEIDSLFRYLEFIGIDITNLNLATGEFKHENKKS